MPGLPMSAKRAAASPGSRSEPHVVQPGRLPPPGGHGSFQHRLDGDAPSEAAADAEPTIEVRRWTAVRDDALDAAEARDHARRTVPSATTPPGQRLEMGGIATTARLALAQALYQQSGAGGSMLDHPAGRSFTLRKTLGAGEVHAPHTVSIPLPLGHATSHEADLAIELEKATLVVDVVPSHAPVLELKARAFDALQLRRQDRGLAILVHVRCATGMNQAQAEALAQGYDVVYGVDESRAHELGVYAALVERITAWARAASAPRRS